jgi:predicted DCC family thiol-disulfide oxidoreductase YuxK
MNKKIIFFDGVCNLCNGLVDWLIVHDSQKLFNYASLQGKTAKELLPLNVINDLNTVVFFENGKIFYRSEAILRLFSYLPYPWKILSFFIILPTFFSNALYNLVAVNRYRLFGKKTTCRLPTLEEKTFFLD